MRDGGLQERQLQALRRSPEVLILFHLQDGGEGAGVWTWGRGREGQLGYSCAGGSAHPRAVDALRGRRVLQVACGGHCTLAVCCHDAEREHAQESPRAGRGRVRAWMAHARLSIDTAPR